MSKKKKTNQKPKAIDSIMTDNYEKTTYDDKHLEKSKDEEKGSTKKKDASSSLKFGHKKGNRGKKKKSSIRRFFNKFKWYLLWCIVSFAIGVFVMSILSKDDSTDVYQLSKPMSLEESIDNVRSSQIDSLQSQLKQIKKDQDDSDNNVDGPKLSKNQKLIADAQSSVNDELNKVLKASMNIKYDADDKKKDKAKDDIKDAVDKKVFDEKKIDNLIDGNSASRELRQYGVKSAGTQPSIIGVDEKDRFVYLTITPFSVKDRTVSVIHIAKMNNDQKLVDLHYVGYIQSYGHQRAKNITNSLNDALKKGTKADKKLDKSIDDTLKEEKKADKKKKDKEKKEKDKKDKKNKKKDSKDKK